MDNTEVNLSTPQFAIDNFQNTIKERIVLSKFDANDFSLEINKIIFSDYSQMIEKIYTIQPNSNRRNIILEECQNLSILKSKQDNSNCFLSKIYMQEYETQIIIYVENYECTIKRLLYSNKLPIVDDVKLKWIKSLLSSFIVTTNLNIHYSNINTENILVTLDWELKLKNFVPCEIESKMLDLNDSGKRIYGGNLFLAPELLEAFNSGMMFIEYDQEKACVFSLGLCIYELFTSRSSVGFNQLCEEQLKESLNIPNKQVMNLLTYMLELNPIKRPTFQQCYKIFLDDWCEFFQDFDHLLNHNIKIQDLADIQPLYQNSNKWVKLYKEKIYAVKKYYINCIENKKKIKQKVFLLNKISENSNDNNWYFKIYWMILEDNISLYLATDWLEYSMMDLIQASNACQLRETAEIIAKELIKFFIELNNKGIYHRDIRPNNIRYIPGISKVTGFSFAKIIDQQNLAKERKIVGQYDYLPPELKIKKDQGMHKSSYNVRKTDIFSLAFALINENKAGYRFKLKYFEASDCGRFT